MELTGEEQRVLGCLIEKSHTTPDQYPLSTNALRLACNQKTSRHPIMDLGAQQVDAVVLGLRDGKWARSVHSKGSRGYKHRHVVDERLGLPNGHQAVLAVLLLRGPQSASELTSRTERYRGVEDVTAILSDLSDQGLARNTGRSSGQSQDRWIHLLGPLAEGNHQPEPDRNHGADQVPPESNQPTSSNAGNEVATVSDRSIETLVARINQLEDRILELEKNRPQST